jgi:DNA repair photolyase
LALSLIPAQQALAGRPGGRLEVREVRCNTLLHGLRYRGSTGYTANLYRGCTHGCVYCYAPSLTHDERGWGTYVDAKVNAPQVLDRELRGARKEEVFLSSASDPYQPVEARYRITRRCLEVLHRHRFPVSILTRSPLVLRDIDLLRKLEWVRVGMSITSVPVRRFEPGVPPLHRRIDTLRRLSEAGLSTWVSLAPVVPGVVLVDMDELFDELGEAGVSSVSFGILRFEGYEESRKMFESRAGMSTSEALSGQDEIVSRLYKLVRQHSMVPNEETPGWSTDSSMPSLDDFQQARKPLAATGQIN